MSAALDWDRDGADWPHREASRFITTNDLRWHVQQMGSGPTLLLAHGTGASTHSWRGLAPVLAQHFTVIAPDLPGHGFTGLPPSYRLSLPAMARGLKTLLASLGATPVVAVGHSAGAAILARMCLDGYIAPSLLVSLNGAIMPPSLAGVAYVAPIVRLIAQVPAVPRFFAWQARNRNVVEKLLGNTGSKVDADGMRFYARLAASPAHAAGALGMMANWDLRPLAHDLPKLKARLVQIVGDKDGLIPPADAVRVQTLVPGATVETQRGLGHLAHEERADETAALIVDAARAAGILPPI